MDATLFGSGKTVLVVDDESDFCTAMEHLLATFGFAVVCAPDGREALEKLKTGTVDVILTDLFMPDMDGIELIRHLRMAGESVPIVAVTGDSHYAAHSVGGAAASLGASAVLMKPFSRDQLASAIGFAWTSHRSTAQERHSHP